MAKSAVRWIRAHASDHGIDPDRLAAGGGSAGGHVAAATATVPGLDEEGEDLDYQLSDPMRWCCSIPFMTMGPRATDSIASGRKNATAKFLPSTTFARAPRRQLSSLGDMDSLIPVATAHRYQKLMQNAGSESVLHIYKGQAHGFFNIRKGGQKIFDQTMEQTDQFLNQTRLPQAPLRVQLCCPLTLSHQQLLFSWMTTCPRTSLPCF